LRPRAATPWQALADWCGQNRRKLAQRAPRPRLISLLPLRYVRPVSGACPVTPRPKSTPLHSISAGLSRKRDIFSETGLRAVRPRTYKTEIAAPDSLPLERSERLLRHVCLCLVPRTELALSSYDRLWMGYSHFPSPFREASVARNWPGLLLKLRCELVAVS
jgi:hypothetical protein